MQGDLPVPTGSQPPPGRGARAAARGGGVTGNGAPRAASAPAPGLCSRRPRGRRESVTTCSRKRSTSPVGSATPGRAEAVGRPTPASLLPVFRLRVLHSKMAPKIQTRTEIRYKCAQWFLGPANLKKSAAIPTAIFGPFGRTRGLYPGQWREGAVSPE